MPYKSEKTPIADEVLDRRVKLLSCQKTMVKRMYDTGLYSIRELSRLWKVSRRTIQFILFPDRHEKNIQDREKRGGSKQYYNKESNTKTMKEHRHYKNDLYKKGLI